MDCLGRPNFWLHILVCTNGRPPGGLPSCKPAGADAVVDHLRAHLTERRLRAKIWLTTTDCLGWCNDEGTTVAIYPDGIFYRKVTVADCPQLIATHIAPLEARRG